MAEGRNYWLVGSLIDGKDETQIILEKGRWWHTTGREAVIEKVKQMQPGEKIALKSTFHQRHNLPFTLPDHVDKLNVAVMRIKATGTVRKNPSNGEWVRVEWDQEQAPRDWYFFTSRDTVWHLDSAAPSFDERKERLVDYVFNNKKQNYDWFIKFKYSSPD